jgi:DNA-directed RNA polymerase specialized sigma24 family protein
MTAIAEIVGAEVGAVKVRLHRARKKLRSALEGYMRYPDARRVRT